MAGVGADRSHLCTDAVKTIGRERGVPGGDVHEEVVCGSQGIEVAGHAADVRGHGFEAERGIVLQRVGERGYEAEHAESVCRGAREVVGISEGEDGADGSEIVVVYEMGVVLLRQRVSRKEHGHEFIVLLHDLLVQVVLCLLAGVLVQLGDGGVFVVCVARVEGGTEVDGAVDVAGATAWAGHRVAEKVVDKRRGVEDMTTLRFTRERH